MTAKLLAVPFEPLPMTTDSVIMTTARERGHRVRTSPFFLTITGKAGLGLGRDKGSLYVVYNS